MVHTTPSPQDCSWVSILHSTLYALYWFIVLTFASVLFSAKARLSKKAKLTILIDDNQTPEPVITSEHHDPNVDVVQEDPIPPVQDTFAEPDERNVMNQPADPPSPSKDEDNLPSPAKGGDDDVVINGTGHTVPGNPVALSKHSAKEEFAAMGKGKWKTDLSSCANLNAQELHSGFLNRLYSSRDYEAGLVNLMKERYEVTSIPNTINVRCTVYQLYCSPEGTVYLFKMNRGFV